MTRNVISVNFRSMHRRYKYFISNYILRVDLPNRVCAMKTHSGCDWMTFNFMQIP